MAKPIRLMMIVTSALVISVLALVVLNGCVALLGTTITRQHVESHEQTGVWVEGTPSLKVIVPNGNLKVLPGESGRIAATITRHGYGPDQALAQQAHDNLEVNFSQQGSAVTLEARPRTTLPNEASDQIDLEVRVPLGSRLELNVANGEVVVRPVGADVITSLANGTVTLNPAPEDSFSFNASVANGAVLSGYPAITGAQGQMLRIHGEVTQDSAPYSLVVNLMNGTVALEPQR
ncbi:MAG: hypothetical protein AB4911_08510 [Oscillochloridaceae bacterium umkhey_bin13]